jgi:prophage maintenance system killer protein
MLVFLLINDVDLKADADEAWAFLAPLYEHGHVCHETLLAWLQANTQPL